MSFSTNQNQNNLHVEHLNRTADSEQGHQGRRRRREH